MRFFVKKIRSVAFLASLAMAFSGTISVRADDSAPNWEQHIQPLLRKYCVGCHAGDDETKGGLGLHTHPALLQGGDSGPAVIPGKSGDSQLVKMMRGTARPKMPPKDTLQPKPAEIELIARWVDLGALPPAGKGTASIPSASPSPVPQIAPRHRLAPPASAVQYSPDGKMLAVALGDAVWIFDAVQAGLLYTLKGSDHPLNAVAFSPESRRVAAAGGTPGLAGQVLLWTLGDPVPRKLQGHADSLYAVSFSPDGKQLLTASYDKLLHTWDSAAGTSLRTLKHHTGAVFSATYDPSGKLIASASADGTVKIWNAHSGERLATLSEPKKGQNSVAFSPLGRELASGGGDKMLRIWAWDGTQAQFRRTKIAHDAPLLAVAYSPDGRTLYSAGEDKLVKAWDAATLQERQVYEKLPDWPQSLAISPNGHLLAVALSDGTVAMFDAQTAARRKDYLTAGKARSLEPRLDAIEPRTAVRGRTVRLTLTGRDVGPADYLFTEPAGLKWKLLTESSADLRKCECELELPADLPPQFVKIGLHTPLGDAGTQSLYVGPFEQIEESGENNTDREARLSPIPATWLGRIERRGDRDVWAFDGKAEMEIVCAGIVPNPAARPRTHLKLVLRDAAGKELQSAHQLNSASMVLLGHRLPATGRYSVEVSDRDFTGSEKHFYAILVGELPVVTQVFPLAALPAGRGAARDAGVAVTGFNIPAKAKVQPAAVGVQHVRVPTPRGPSLNEALFCGSTFAEFVEREPNDTPTQAFALPVPAGISGRISRPMVPGGSPADYMSFEARRGERLVLEVFARRLGSPLDSVIEIFGADGQPVIQHTLRAVSETYTVLRDHDSSAEGIRLNNWEDFRINDYLLLGSDVVKLFRLPTGPDEDLRFYSSGVRLGFFGTTPESHALNRPVYKVEVHPPHTPFPSNGLPVVQLPYRNDDGGPGFRSDSRLLFDAPADGRYFVRIRDVRDLSGDDFVYRLVVRRREEDFRVSVTPENFNVPRGGARTFEVNVERLDGFEGAIDVQLENPPPGITAVPVRIEAGAFRGQLHLSASETAPVVPVTGSSVKIIGRANRGGQLVEHATTPEFGRHQVTVAAASDLVFRVEPCEATITPGQFVKFTVTLERRAGFTGRVPIFPLNLPTSLYMLDLGLNGVLITETSTTQTFTVGCYNFAQPGRYPLFITGKDEAKNLSYAAPPVTLVVPRAPGLAAASR